MNLVKIEQEAQGTVKLSRYVNGENCEVVRMHLNDCNKNCSLGATVEDFRSYGSAEPVATPWESVVKNLT
jgi:hypothetical protein